ncbi:CHAT domain-containing protein [Nocardia sp. NPDC060249]|uniref:CHAT domain-containing protein n=1 Tax=Nocardia sp. NPDC060249 TaxID=3347082 RepID=UPI00365AF4C5
MPCESRVPMPCESRAPVRESRWVELRERWEASTTARERAASTNSEGAASPNSANDGARDDVVDRQPLNETEGFGFRRPRHLRAVLPERVETGRTVSLIVSITAATNGAGISAPLKDFDVPSEGAVVTLSVSSRGLVPRGESEQDIRVPSDGDSEPHRFAFIAGPVGLHHVNVDAYRGGTHLGTVRLEISVEANATISEARVRTAELSTVAFEPGEVTLQVRLEEQGYRFQLLGDTLYSDVTAMMGDSRDSVEQLVAELHAMAADQSDYATPGLVRDRLKSLGIELWSSAVPKGIQEQFWEQSDRIRMLTVAADHDVIPWELLYPLNGSNDNGFLAEQFPVMRRAYAARRVTTLPIGGAAYVVPPASPSDAMVEVEAIRALLGTRAGDHGVLSELSDVRRLVLGDLGLPGIMHFACHNTFSDRSGSSITLDGGPWKPSDLAEAVQRATLADAAPLVFLNACRSAGQMAWFSQMSGWGTKFIEAGAGAFIGSLWAVRSSAARAFAEEFYQQFVGKGQPLGASSLSARQVVQSDGGDPTWLAYTVYGNPAAVATY